MADAPRVTVKKYKSTKVKVAASSPNLPPKPGRANSLNDGAAAVFAAQQQKQQQAALRQQQAYAQQRAQQQFQSMTPQQRAAYQQQGQMQAAAAGLSLQQQQQYAVMSPQQRAQFQQQLRAQKAAQQQAAQNMSPQQQQMLRAQQQRAYQANLQRQAKAKAEAEAKAAAAAAAAATAAAAAADVVKEEPALPSKPFIPTKPKELPKPNLTRKLTGKEVELFWPLDNNPFEQPDGAENIIFDDKDEGSSKPKIKAATIEKLVAKATNFAADSTLQKTLLLTYRSMIGTEELLDLLMKRFSMPLPEGNEISLEAFKGKKQKPIQVRVCQLLKTWITKNFADFHGNVPLQEKLLSFCRDIIKPVCPPGATLESIVQRQMSGEYEKEVKNTEPPPKPILPAKPRPSFLDIHPIEIARQMTIIETELYRAIRPHECSGLAWSKKNAKDRAPNILAMINRFNVVSNWVSSEIVKQETKKQRVDTLNHFIEIAERCRTLNNFNGCMEIISGLGDSSVHRLKEHWDELPPRSQGYYKDLKVILSSQSSYKNFRAHLKTCTGACIPYLGMYLTDLTFIEDGNNDKIGELHNFAKRLFVSSVIQEIQQYQQFPYLLQTVPAIHNFFNSLQEKTMDKEACYQRSLQILPRGGKASGEPTKTKLEGDDYGEMEQISGYRFNEKDSPKNIKFQTISGSERVVAASIEKVVERVTFKSFPERQFLDAILLTYRAYITGKELFELLVMRFNMPLPKDSEQMERFKKSELLPVQLRVVNVLKNWVENYPYDFVLEKELAVDFFAFVNGNTSLNANSLKRIAKTLKQNTKQNRARRGTVSGAVPPVHALQPGADPTNLRLLDFHPEEVARQICLYDGNLLQNTRPIELLDQIWLSEPKRARNILQLICRESAYKNWVAKLVVQSEASERRKMLSHLILIAYFCYELHNYNAVVGLYRGLQSPQVTSLTQTWNSLDQATTEKLNSIKSVASNLKSIRVFREHVKQESREEASIYPLEPYLQEIARHEELDDYVNDTMINMEKNRKLNASVDEFLSARNTPYTFESQPWLQDYLKKTVTSFADRDTFSDQIPLSEQIAAMSTNNVKAAIKSEMLSDESIKGELLRSLQKTLLAEVAHEELQTFQDQVETFKQEMRQQIESVHLKFKRGTFSEYLSEDSLSARFGGDLDQLEDWVLDDQEGTVYGWPQQIEIPRLSTAEGETYLVYQRNIFDKDELSLFLRIKHFYEQYNDEEVATRLVAVSSYIAPNVRPFAEQHDVELICIGC